MKTTSTAALLSIALLGACHREAETTGESPPAAVPRFSAKAGLLLPEDTRKSLGLKLVEVSEQKVESSLSFPVCVYQADPSIGRASGSVSPAVAMLATIGQSVQLVKSGGGLMTGKIESLSSALEPSTGMLEVLVAFPGDTTVEVGSALEVSLASPSKGAAVTIPRSALLSCSEGQFVYALSGESFVRTAVKIGGGNADLLEVTDGLYAGDQIVAQPVMSLWMTELAAVKGGQSCCIEPPKGK